MAKIYQELKETRQKILLGENPKIIISWRDGRWYVFTFSQYQWIFSSALYKLYVLPWKYIVSVAQILN